MSVQQAEAVGADESRAVRADEIQQVLLERRPVGTGLGEARRQDQQALGPGAQGIGRHLEHVAGGNGHHDKVRPFGQRATEA